MKGAFLASTLRRDRWIVIGSLSAVVAVSWLYLFWGVGMDMEAMSDMAMPMTPVPWSASYSSLILTMWLVMMAAMMLPSAAPVILLYDAIARRRRLQSDGVPQAGFFALGYLLVWGAAGLFGTVLQWTLDKALLLSPHMATTSVAVAGFTLIAAGLYQWTPLKQACLRHCRSPLEFLLTNWREGAPGAVTMGVRHGLYCLGCCWMLMLLLFVGGVMNLFWVAALTLFILAEKILPGGRRLSHLAGAALVVWGGAVWISAV